MAFVSQRIVMLHTSSNFPYPLIPLLWVCRESVPVLISLASFPSETVTGVPDCLLTVSPPAAASPHRAATCARVPSRRRRRRGVRAPVRGGERRRPPRFDRQCSRNVRRDGQGRIKRRRRDRTTLSVIPSHTWGGSLHRCSLLHQATQTRGWHAWSVARTLQRNCGTAGRNREVAGVSSWRTQQVWGRHWDVLLTRDGHCQLGLLSAGVPALLRYPRWGVCVRRPVSWGTVPLVPWNAMLWVKTFICKRQSLKPATDFWELIDVCCKCLGPQCSISHSLSKRWSTSNFWVPPSL